LSGCAIQRIHHDLHQVDHDNSEAVGYVHQMTHARSLVDGRSVLRQMNSIWVDTTPVALNPQSVGAAPTALDCPITFNPRAAVSISDFARLVSTSCGVAVHVDDNVIPALMGTLKGGGGGGNSVSVSNSTLPPPTLGKSGDAGVSAVGTNSSGMISGITWVNQPLTGLLDLVTAHLGLGWKYKDNTITIFYTDTRVFQLYSIPGKVKMGTKVRSGADTSSSGGGGAGGTTAQQTGSFNADGSSQSTEVEFSTDVLSDIQKTLQAMITPGLGRLAVSPSTGTVTVTDRPEVLKRVKAFIDRENTQLTRQVVLNVRVLSVQLSSSDSAGIDWNMVYQSLGHFAGGIGSATTAAANNLGNVKVINSTSGWNGTQAFINALSSQGKVSTLTSPTVRTLNLRPAPVLVGKQTTYLAQVSTTALAGDSSGSSSTQSMTPGTVTTGFNMTLLPYLMKGPDMLLEYSVNLSALTAMNEIDGQDGNKIQMPDIDNRIFSNTVRLRSGQTLVLSGFDQSTTNATNQGVGDPSFWLLGGKGSSDKTHDVIVVLITPIITD